MDAKAAVVFEKTEVFEDQAKTTFDMLFEAEPPGSVMLRINGSAVRPSSVRDEIWSS